MSFESWLYPLLRVSKYLLRQTAGLLEGRQTMDKAFFLGRKAERMFIFFVGVEPSTQMF
jgi:hypothetical protein